MKKVFALLLAMLMVLTILSGCKKSGGEQADGKGQEENSQEENSQSEEDLLASVKTFADIQAMEGVEFGEKTSFEEKLLIVAFTLKDGTIYRAVADITPEQDQAIWDVDFFADDYEEQVAAILAPIEIKQIDNLSQNMPSQKELDQLTGKTGQDLLNDGWMMNGCYLDERQFYVSNGMFEYVVVTKDAIQYDENGDIDAEEIFKTQIVESVSFSRLDNAAYDIEQELYGE